MKRIIVPQVLSDEQCLGMMGKFIDEKYIQILVNEDCDVYTEDDKPLLFLRKNVVSFDLAMRSWESLRVAATPTDNRGAAADISSKWLDKKSARYAKVNSGIIGYYDRYVRIPYCRQTAFNQNHLEKFKIAYPYIKLINETLKEVVPVRYNEQLRIIQRTHPDFYIKDTVFTTVTVNKNYRTALHVDKGDYRYGFGTLGVLAAGRYDGAYTCIPKYGVAVDCRSRDIACFDVHELHGNTPFIGVEGRYERISVVCYYREKMFQCGSAKDELERAKNRKLGDKLYDKSSPHD